MILVSLKSESEGGPVDGGLSTLFFGAKNWCAGSRSTDLVGAMFSAPSLAGGSRSSRSSLSAVKQTTPLCSCGSFPCSIPCAAKKACPSRNRATASI